MQNPRGIVPSRDHVTSVTPYITITTTTTIIMTSRRLIPVLRSIPVLSQIILFMLLITRSIVLVSSWSFQSAGITITRYRSPTPRLRMSEQEEEDDDDKHGDFTDGQSKQQHSGYNVLGTDLLCCCSNVGNSGVGTGFYRNGFCATGDMDLGRHTVCVRVNNDFLIYSKSVGNDLSTPMPQYNFPGLKEGDIWCLCAQRWAQAYNAGKAPSLYLQATHEKTLDYIPLDILRIFAIDADEANQVLNRLTSQRNQLNKILMHDEEREENSFQ